MSKTLLKSIPRSQVEETGLWKSSINVNINKSKDQPVKKDKKVKVDNVINCSNDKQMISEGLRNKLLIIDYSVFRKTKEEKEIVAYRKKNLEPFKNKILYRFKVGSDGIN